MKAIIFDVDWVIIKSDNKKKEIIKDILTELGVYHLPWVLEILNQWFNRKLVFKNIAKIHNFDSGRALDEMNKRQALLESNPTANLNIIDFIKNNNKYLFFTNTSLPQEWLERVMKALGIRKYFKELLSFDHGSKLENINFVLEKYKLLPQEILFIDDNINHLTRVKGSGVHMLHFTNYDINIEDEIFNIENK